MASSHSRLDSAVILIYFFDPHVFQGSNDSYTVTVWMVNILSWGPSLPPFVALQPIHFEQMHSVRSMFETRQQSQPEQVPLQSKKASKWDKPKTPVPPPVNRETEADQRRVEEYSAEQQQEIFDQGDREIVREGTEKEEVPQKTKLTKDWFIWGLCLEFFMNLCTEEVDSYLKAQIWHHGPWRTR